MLPRSFSTVARSPDKVRAMESLHANIKGYQCDATDPNSVAEVVENVEKDLGNIHTLIYNAGNGVWKTYDKIQHNEFDMCMKTNLYGLLYFSQQICPKMAKRGEGFVAVTGATASLRGKPFTAGFASAKGAQRMLSQSLARDLGPKNVHVFYAIIDGGVRAGAAEGSKQMNPDHIAQAYWDTAQQRSSAWTAELDLRPFCESW